MSRAKGTLPIHRAQTQGTAHKLSFGVGVAYQKDFPTLGNETNKKKRKWKRKRKRKRKREETALRPINYI